MTIQQRFNTCVTLALSIFAASSVDAGQIDSINWFSGVASVAGEFIGPVVADGTDNIVGDSPNELFILQKDYTAIGPVDLVMDVSDNLGVTEYVIIEGVQNNTGLTWSGYHIELGFGEGAGFVKSLAEDGLDFDYPHYDSTTFFNPLPGFFPLVTVTQDDIIAGGGVMNHLDYAGNFVFHIDVPNGISSFTIRQSPIEQTSAVPEPSTYAMGVLSLLAFALYGWRKRSVR